MFKQYFNNTSCWALLCFYLLYPFFSIADLSHKEPESTSLKFIENKGQWIDLIKFKAELSSGAVFFEKNTITYNFWDNSYLNNTHNSTLDTSADLVYKSHALKVNFLQANPNVSIAGESVYEDYFNYFIGDDPRRWASNVRAYKKINYDNIYEGINLDIYNSQNNLKYDFVVHPQANPAKIRFNYTGADSIFILDGNLIVQTSLGVIREKKPLSYQVINGKYKAIPCEFQLEGNEVSFNFPKGYNKDYVLTIDPELIFSTYSGSFADNFGYTATFDSEGFLYAAGSVFDVGYPITTGAFQSKFIGGTVNDTLRYNNGDIYVDRLGYIYIEKVPGTDIGITKYDTTGTKIIYSTYLGGKLSELPHSIIVNSQDELLLYGTTGSADFPLKNPIYSTFMGGESINMRGLGMSFTSGSDIFIAKLNSTGTDIVASTYIGGKKNDGLNTTVRKFAPFNTFSPLTYNYADEVRGEIDLDKDNNIYIITSTNSTDFPIVGNTIQPNFGGGISDGCILKLDQDLKKIIWSSYLGGEGSDSGYSIEIDKTSNIYVCGGTTSPDLRTTSGSLYNQYQGGQADGYISHISADGSQLLHGTYYGYKNYDQIYFVELDNQDNVYVFGQTENAGNFFIKNALYAKPNAGQFISKISPQLDSLVWSTSFGTGSGYPDISPTAFLVDLCNKIYLSGWGGETNDFYVFKNDTLQRANHAGYTYGLDVTSDAFQKTTDSSDFYLMVLADDASQLVYGSFFGGNISHEHVDGGTSRFDRTGKIYQSVCAGCGGNSDFPIKPLDAVSATNNSIRPYINCNNGVFKFDFKLPIVIADFKVTGCNPIQFTNKSFVQKATSFKWNFGDNTTSTEANPTHTYTSSGTFKVSLSLFDNFTCNLSDSIVKEIYISPLSLGISATADPTTIYKNMSSQLQAYPQTGYTYSWTPTNTLNDATVANPIASPKDTTTYTVTIIDPQNKCPYNASVTVNVIDIICGEPNIYIPNAFTPNNDGKNEELFVRGEVLQEFSLIIYDRWGEKVFETNDQKKGWNGYFRDMKADPGVFVYYLEATCINQDKFVKKGNITLIR